MKFIRVLKANNEQYRNMIEDIASNFQKITGVPVEKIFNPPSVDLPMFDDVVIEQTFPKVKEYVLKKYDVDISTHPDFVYDLDDELSKYYPNY